MVLGCWLEKNTEGVWLLSVCSNLDELYVYGH
jgi:hypothetical protein